MINFSPEEIDILLTSLHYSEQAINDGRDASYEIKKEKLSQIEAIKKKLQAELR